MFAFIHFGAYEIDSRVMFICRKDKIEKDIPVKSLLLILKREPKLTQNPML